MVPFFELSLDDGVSSAIRQKHLHVSDWILRVPCACCRGEYTRSICMKWIRALVGVLVLWSSTAGGATLTWNPESDPDLAGYRVYHCSQLPCTRTSDTASLLNTLGKVTSLNIGTPAVTQYYFITAYNYTNHESGGSNLVTFTPGAIPPPP